MAGIFPSAGISAPNTSGGDAGIDNVPGCDLLFYRSNCSPRFDPVAMNYLISEIGNAVNALGDEYNCSATDNLKKTLQKLNNWCNRGVIHPTGDLSDDFVMACLAGVQGKMPLQDILNLVGGPCGYPDVPNPSLQDSLAGCFNGATGKTPISALLQLILGQIGPASVGAPFYSPSFNIPFPNNQQNDTNVFDASTIDAIQVTNPESVTFATVGGPTHVLMPVGSTLFDVMNLEKIDGQWYKMYGISRNIIGFMATGDQTQAYMTRSEQHQTSLTAMNKFPPA